MLMGFSWRLLCVCSIELVLTLSMPGADSSVRRALPVQPLPAPQPSETPTLPLFRMSGVADDPTGAAGASIYPSDAPLTAASSAIMIDAKTGAVLFMKNPDVRRPVASTQKLLTALILVQAGNLDAPDRVISTDCQVEPTKLGFRPGDVYTKRQLLAALLVHSCNDAAICLARNEAGSIPAFAERMNAKAFSLGAPKSFCESKRATRTGPILNCPKHGPDRFRRVSPTCFAPVYAIDRLQFYLHFRSSSLF